MSGLTDDERHDMIDRIAAIIHAVLGRYLEESNAHDLVETEAAVAVVEALFPKVPGP